MEFVRNMTSYMSDSIVPSMLEAHELERQAYELFILVRDVRFQESPEAVARYRERLAMYQKVEKLLVELHVADPELRAPSYVVRTVVPIAKNYIDLVERMLTTIDKKKALHQALLKAGFDVSNEAENLVSVFYAKAMTHVKNADIVGISRDFEAMLLNVKLLDAVTDLRTSFLRAMADDDIPAMRATADLVSGIKRHMDGLTRHLQNDEGKKAMTPFTDAVDNYLTNLNSFVKAYDELQSLHNARAPLMDSFNIESSAAADQALARVKEISSVNLDDLNSSIMTTGVSVAVSVILGIGIALFISRSIAKPLNTIVSLARRAGDGDLTIEKEDFGYDSRDELGNMVAALSNMVQAQGETVEQVVAIANDLSNAASNLSAISEETNASMEEVKASIDQVTTLSESNGAALEQSNAGVEEMSAGADTVAQSATDSAAFISQTTEASNKAIQTVNNVIAGMRNVDANSKESENKMHQLVASVENVSSFVSVITGIADQTNLLALNAAIEAARAGEVGRGFAVVAEEVRKLAEESARAAQNVNGIIVELQTGAQESIKATTEAGRMLVETLVSAERAQAELNGALAEMNKANDSIQNIAAVAEEQAASSREVASAIDNATKSTMEVVDTIASIRHASEETAQASQGVAEQSSGMTSHAQNMMTLLSRFKLRGQTPPPAAIQVLTPKTLVRR
jgi:methyl-accepting chemotaxis protein